ncbi:MAG: TolC family protein [Bacteroidetes bacterium]|nr:MAG: TolC family protein [Bacteroidota bacterium]
MKKIILVLAVTATFNSARSQSPSPSGQPQVASEAQGMGPFSFSLQQAIDFAMKNQTQMQNTGYDEQIAKHKVKETIGIGLPLIHGNVGAQDFLEIPTSVLPANAFNPFASPDELMAVQFGTQYSASAGIEASQLVFSSDYLVGLQASKTFLELSRKAVQRTRVETSVAVSKAYYTVLLNEERMKLIDANISRLKKLMDDTQVLNTNGFVEKIDLDRITVAYNNLVVEKEKIQRLMGLGNSFLKFQMGMDQQANLSVADKLADIKLTPPADAGKIDYENRVEYSLMQSQKNISQLQLKRNKLTYLPSAALFGNASANAYRNKFNFFDAKLGWYPTLIIGARINVGIFDGLQTHHRIQQSKLEILKADNSLKMIQQGIDLEIASAKANLTNSASSLEIQKKNIELAESIYKAAKMKYEQGVGSNLEVMSAETGLKEAQTNYFSALYDALIAKVDYDKANGNIK